MDAVLKTSLDYAIDALRRRQEALWKEVIQAETEAKYTVAMLEHNSVRIAKEHLIKEFFPKTYEQYQQRESS